MFVPSQSLSYDGHPADGAISLGRSRSNPGVAAWPGSRVSRDSGLPTLSRVTIFLKNPPCGKQTRQIYACPQVQPRFPHMPHFLPRKGLASFPGPLVCEGLYVGPRRPNPTEKPGVSRVHHFPSRTHLVQQARNGWCGVLRLAAVQRGRWQGGNSGPEDQEGEPSPH